VSAGRLSARPAGGVSLRWEVQLVGKCKSPGGDGLLLRDEAACRARET